MGQGVCAGAALGYLLLGDRKQAKGEFRSQGWGRAGCPHPGPRMW